MKGKITYFLILREAFLRLKKAVVWFIKDRIYEQVLVDDACGNEPSPFMGVGDVMEYTWVARVTLGSAITEKRGFLLVTGIDRWGSVDYIILDSGETSTCNRYWLRHVESWRVNALR